MNCCDMNFRSRCINTAANHDCCCHQEEQQEARLRGISVRLTNGTTLETGTPVLFDTIVSSDGRAITYEPDTGSFFIRRPGTYYISWFVNIRQEGASALRLVATVNGANAVQMDYYAEQGTLYGSGLIHVDEEPVVVQLRNLSDVAITYDTELSTLAGMTIIYVC